MSPARDAILIFGYGKSGTKRLLHAFDLSPLTHCRNEPYNHAGSPWQPLRQAPASYLAQPEDDARLAASWDAALDWCRERMGERDRLPPPPKAHLRPLARRLGLLHALGSRRVRRTAGRFVPGLSGAEWRLPGWAGDRAALARARLVLKLNQAPSVARWVLANRPEHAVLHIVRHPAAVLDSWSRRFLRGADASRVLRDNRERLARIARAEPGWAERFGDIDAMGVERAELWFWLYAAEVTHAAGEGRDAYRLVLDEDVMLRPVETLRELYDTVGLPWSPQVEAGLRRRADEWAACSAPWRDRVEREHVPLVEDMLAASALAGRWEPEQRVSGIDYS